MVGAQGTVTPRKRFLDENTPTVGNQTDLETLFG